MREDGVVGLESANAELAVRVTPGLAAVTDIWRSFGIPGHDLRAEATSIAAPAVLVWGRHDPVLPVRVGEAATDLILGSRLVVIDCGHCHGHRTGRPCRLIVAATGLTRSAETNLDRQSKSY